MPRVVLLGTGTSVGKTYVARALASSLGRVEPAAPIGVLKPIETGITPCEPTDAATLGQAVRHCSPPRKHPLYGYPDPLTPYLAAQRAGAPGVDLASTVRWVADWEREVRSTSGRFWTLVETAGGVFSPLGRDMTNFELWQALLPCAAVLVARDGLGTLHDITATLEALRARQRTPEALVLSAGPRPDASTGTNAAVLRELGLADPDAVLGTGSGDLEELARKLALAFPLSGARS